MREAEAEAAELALIRSAPETPHQLFAAARRRAHRPRGPAC